MVINRRPLECGKGVGTICVLAVLLLSPTVLFADPVWVSFDGSPLPASPQVQVVSSDFSRTVIHITVPGLMVQDTVVDGTTYQILRLPKEGAVGETGRPFLPGVSRFVAIPPTSDVAISLCDSTTFTLEGYTVWPTQPGAPIGEPAPPFTIDEEFYTRDLFYPEEIAVVGRPGIWRDIRVVTTNIRPITFNPAQHLLKAHPEMTVVLDYSGINNANILPHGYPSRVSRRYAEMYRPAVINYDFLGIGLADNPPLGRCLVLTPEELVDEIAPLVTWEYKKGYYTAITQFSAAPSQDEIKQVITEEYSSPLGLDYVLLLGDRQDMPWYFPLHGVLPPGDFWYTCVAGDDTIPDLAIGRFSVDAYNTSVAEQQVIRLVNATLRYETGPFDGWDVGQTVFAAHWGNEGGGYAYTQRKEDLVAEGPAWWAPAGYGVGRCYGTSNPHPNNEDLAALINDDASPVGGVGLLNYYGHGESFRWKEWAYAGQISFTIDDIYNLLHNANRLPIWAHMACLVGNLSYTPECFCEALTRFADGGATGAIGASRPIYDASDGGTGYNGFFDRWLMVAIFNPTQSPQAAWPINEMSDAINYAKIQCFLQTSQNETQHKHAVVGLFALLYLGVPETPVWTAYPAALQATHPELIEPGPTVFPVDVDPDPHQYLQTYVCLWKPGEFRDGGYTDENGHITFEISPRQPGWIYVTATKRSFMNQTISIYDSSVPYQDSCGVQYSVTPPLLSVRSCFDSCTAIPKEFALHKNVPNPFSAETSIRYDLPRESQVALRVYDITGRLVKTLVAEDRQPGCYVVSWNGEHEDGREMATGVYLYQIGVHQTDGRAAGEFVDTQKAILMR